MRKKLLLLLSVVVMTISISFVVYANDYETDKVPITNSTTKTSTTEYTPDKTTTTPSEISSTTKKRPSTVCDHIEGDILKENEVAPSCAQSGSYDLVTYCLICNEPISRETKTVAPLGHIYVFDSFENGVASIHCQREDCSKTKTILFAEHYNVNVNEESILLDANNDSFINAKDFAILDKK